jgi:hypothetical protein
MAQAVQNIQLRTFFNIFSTSKNFLKNKEVQIKKSASRQTLTETFAGMAKPSSLSYAVLSLIVWENAAPQTGANKPRRKAKNSLREGVKEYLGSWLHYIALYLYLQG